MRGATRASAGARGATGPVCPRCGSGEVRNLSAIHRSGLSAGGPNAAAADALSRQAAPPVPKPTWPWVLVACASLALLVATMASSGLATALPIGVGAAAVHIALRARRYNRTTYAELRRRWECSYMCSRCGDIFEMPKHARP